MIVWIIGIAGSGKSTLAKLVHGSFIKLKKPSVLLDGDYIRELFSYDLDYTKKGKLKNAKRIMSLCNLLDSNNINVFVQYYQFQKMIEIGAEKIFQNILKYTLNLILILSMATVKFMMILIKAYLIT